MEPGQPCARWRHRSHGINRTPIDIDRTPIRDRHCPPQRWNRRLQRPTHPGALHHSAHPPHLPPAPVASSWQPQPSLHPHQRQHNPVQYGSTGSDSHAVAVHLQPIMPFALPRMMHPLIPPQLRPSTAVPPMQAVTLLHTPFLQPGTPYQASCLENCSRPALLREPTYSICSRHSAHQRARKEQICASDIHDCTRSSSSSISCVTFDKGGRGAVNPSFM